MKDKSEGLFAPVSMSCKASKSLKPALLLELLGAHELVFARLSCHGLSGVKLPGTGLAAYGWEHTVLGSRVWICEDGL